MQYYLKLQTFFEYTGATLIVSQGLTNVKNPANWKYKDLKNKFGIQILNFITKLCNFVYNNIPITVHNY